MIIESEHSQEFHDILNTYIPIHPDKFQERMAQAMTVSYYKYGPLAEAYQHKVNALSSLKKRLRLYQNTGNGDYLIDIGNFAMIEFMRPSTNDFVKGSLFDLPINRNIDHINICLDEYIQTGHAHILILIAAIAKREYYDPTHKNFHDTPTDGGEGRVWHGGGPANSKDNQGERIRF